MDSSGLFIREGSFSLSVRAEETQAGLSHKDTVLYLLAANMAAIRDRAEKINLYFFLEVKSN